MTALLAATTFTAIGTSHRIVATDAAALPEARALALDHLRALDAAASRFRPDSEVARLAAAARHGVATAHVSEILGDYVRAALRAAALTGGLVDPTVGAAVVATGYDADIAVVRARRTAVAAGAAAVPGWRTVLLDDLTDLLTVPAGCLLDLGSTAKAHAADTIARLLATLLPGGFLVDLGGDVAVAGPVPDAGWQVGVEAADGRVLQVVATTGQALATSSTRLRRWATSAGVAHHVVDPRTGTTAPGTWAQVACAGASALEANAASTAAIVLGPAAPSWLADRGVPARLDGADGSVRVTPGWPSLERRWAA